MPIKLPIKGGTWVAPLLYELVLREKFDPESLLREINKMEIWLESNPHRKPTVKGVRRFIGNWLNKSGVQKPLLATEASNSIVRGESWKRTQESQQVAAQNLLQIRKMIGR